jgi:YD repeat-containing protein
MMLIFAAATASSQVATGTPPFTSLGGGPFDSVNLGNLNVHFAVPIVHKAGRGMPFTYDFSYDSSIWYPSGGTWAHDPNWGWRGVTEALVGFLTVKSNGMSCDAAHGGGGLSGTHIDWFDYHDPSGAVHRIPIGAHGGDTCAGFPGSWFSASDGSGYAINLVIDPPVNNYFGYTATLYSRSGNKITPDGGNGAGSIADPNGNTLTAAYSSGITTFTDTLNTNTLKVTNVTGTTYPQKFSYLNPSGGYTDVNVNYSTNNTVETKFACGTPTDVTVPGVSLISSIGPFPDGSSYSFLYEGTPGNSNHTTGRIAQVTLPSGGTILYQYAATNDGVNCADGSTAGLSRTVTPGGPWTYSRSLSGSTWTTTVLDPANNNTVINFAKDSATTNPTNNFYELQRQVYQGTSNLLLTTTNCWNNNFTTCPTQAVKSPITKLDHYRSLPGVTYPAVSETVYDPTYGLLLQDKETDYVQVSNGSPTLKVTTITYATNIGNNIVDRPACAQVTAATPASGCGTVTNDTASLTTYTYDAGGNVLTSNNWVSGSGSSAKWLSRGFSSYLKGQPRTVTDVNGAPTYLTYGDCNNNSQLTNQVSLPVNGLSGSVTVDCNGGVVVSQTGVSGYPIGLGYTDPFWRPTSVTDQASNVTNISYTQTSVSTSTPFNGANLQHVTTLDGFGRPILQQTYQGSGTGNWDTVRTTYNTLGQISNVTAPFSCSTTGASCTSTIQSSITYDALGRVKTATDVNGGTVSHTYTGIDDSVVLGPAPLRTRQSQFDGLGRLTSVCEESALSGTAPCAGQAGTPTGYLTSYAYNAAGRLTQVTQGTQLRTFYYDGLGRLINETNPENGTTAYYFDSDPTNCNNPSSPGDLASIWVSKPSITCFWFDKLHRLVARTSTDGSSKNSNYTWDSATVNGQAVGQKGKIAEAWTCPYSSKLCAGAHQTDEGFQYDSRGKMIGYFQQSPNSGGWYTNSASYDAIGGLLTLAIPGIPTITATAWDGEGRPTFFSATGTVPMSAAIYGPFGPTSVTYGSGDSDVFGYDNLGHIGSYQLNVGSQNYTGTVNWNANGTVQNLKTVDLITGGNSHTTTTVSYGYDDLGRLASAGDGGTLSQTYTYDQYGNINTTGNPTSWTQAYATPSTNRYATTGSCSNGIQYDNDGNLSCDFFHAYTWDGTNQLLSVDGHAILRDAFDRVVESNGLEILYSTIGKLGFVNGQTMTKIRIPLPGGGQAIYNGGTLAKFNHPDWQGNIRVASKATTHTLAGQSEYTPFGMPYNEAPAGSTPCKAAGFNPTSQACRRLTQAIPRPGTGMPTSATIR